MNKRQVARHLAAVALGVATTGCLSRDSWHNVDVTGDLPGLTFQLVRAGDGKLVTAADYRGKVVLLYFGYTYCPDACPTTLTNLSLALSRLGPRADQVRVLFVSVDPRRDDLAALKQYAAAFAPQVDALRGDENAVASLARRYRIAYSATAAAPGRKYEVTHSSAIYVFDRAGVARLLIPSLSTGNADIADAAKDLGRLTDAPA